MTDQTAKESITESPGGEGRGGGNRACPLRRGFHNTETIHGRTEMRREDSH